MDVAEYIKRKQKEQNKQQKATNQEQPTAQKTDTAANYNKSNNQEMLGKYSKMNEEQLMQELFKVGSVSSGKVSSEALDNFYKNISAKLTPEQASRMRDLISQLKRS